MSVDGTPTTSSNGGGQPTSDELLLMLYRSMKLISVADERARAEARAGRLQAALYPVHGLEGVCAALGLSLRTDDYYVATYRNLGDALAKGVPLRAIIAEAYGRLDGTSKGKGGPMHLLWRDVGFMPTTGIVGSGLSMAVGLALASSLEGSDRVTATTFGDGATSIGPFHEAVNLASLWKLPVVLVCQNNQWAEHTAFADHAPVPDLAAKVASYGIDSVAVDGFDATATMDTISRAVETCRAGGGPQFVECRTYRLTGHSATADMSYMPADELADAEERHPLRSLRARLEGSDLSSQLDGIDDGIAAEVDDAFRFADASPAPDADEMQRDMYADDSMGAFT